MSLYRSRLHEGVVEACEAEGSATRRQGRDRRGFLKSAGALLAAPWMSAVCGWAEGAPAVAGPVATGGPVIDAHIHLFDTARKEGVPWPFKTDAVLYKPALPPRYEAVTRGMGVVGAIAVEASPLRSDNDWLLNVVRQNPIMVGAVGDLVPGTSEFPADLERLRKDPLLLGIRYGNLWERDLAADLDKPLFLDHLKLVAEAGLVFESANPDGRLIGALARIAEAMPHLRMVVDHLPHAVIPTEAGELSRYREHLKTLSEAPEVYVKISEIPNGEPGQDMQNVERYRDVLDRIWDEFGQEKLLFGSDWPNSDHLLSYAETFSLFRRYVRTKGVGALEKVEWKNSLQAYRWRARTAAQRSLVGQAADGGVRG